MIEEIDPLFFCGISILIWGRHMKNMTKLLSVLRECISFGSCTVRMSMSVDRQFFSFSSLFLFLIGIVNKLDMPTGSRR